jgi:hypothetical protein
LKGFPDHDREELIAERTVATPSWLSPGKQLFPSDGFGPSAPLVR